MPFELGLSFAIEKLDQRIDPANRHTWFVFETINRRLAKSLSDLSGIDPSIHNGTVKGGMRELGNCFIRHSKSDQPTVPEMLRTYRTVAKLVPDIQRQTGAVSLYEPVIFKQLCFAAREAASLISR